MNICIIWASCYIYNITLKLCKYYSYIITWFRHIDSNHIQAIVEVFNNQYGKFTLWCKIFCNRFIFALNSKVDFENWFNCRISYVLATKKEPYLIKLQNDTDSLYHITAWKMAYLLFAVKGLIPIGV